jgi:polysaccharide biosynthesis protein PslH
LRILYIVPYTPNLIRVRPYNLIRYLSDRGNEVTIATLTTNRSEQAAAMTLNSERRCMVSRPMPRWRSLANCLVALPTNTPLQSAYSWHSGLARQLASLLFDELGRPNFDVIHVEHLRGVRYGLFLLRLIQAGKHRFPIVWDSVDCISHLFEQTVAHSHSRLKRWGMHLELTRTRKYEASMVRLFDQTTVTSPIDRQALSDLASKDVEAASPITVLPNGVDLDYFKPSSRVTRETHSLVISGKMSYHANVAMVMHMVNEIMPLIWEHQPETRLTIVGKDPPREIKALDQRPSISVTGTVPDIRSYLQQATLAVAPIIYGAGIQNKVLEAMACATPVVVSPQAAAALSAVPGEDFLVADGAADFAETILALMDDQERLQKIGASGRAYVEAFHDWNTIAERLEKLYVSLCSS